MKKPRRNRDVDMSPTAVSKRLEELASLYELGVSLRRAKIVKTIEPSPSDESRTEPVKAKR
jgi:hypothetical protein